MSDIRRREKHRDSREKSKSSRNAQPVRRLLDGYSERIPANQRVAHCFSDAVNVPLGAYDISYTVACLIKLMCLQASSCNVLFWVTLVFPIAMRRIICRV